MGCEQDLILIFRILHTCNGISWVGLLVYCDTCKQKFTDWYGYWSFGNLLYEVNNA